MSGLRHIRFFAAIWLCASAFGQAPASGTRTLEIDLRAETRPFPHYWEQMFGSGRAVLSLRESYRRDLASVRKITNFEYVRFHAIFDRETGVYAEDESGHPVYNWSYVDQIYDGLLANGVKPFVELSFMPAGLAENLQWHAFWYRPLPSPPRDYTKWEELVYQFTKHLVERYGREETAQWYFEVWNEPNIDFWTGVPKQATYFELYDHAAHAVKRAGTFLRVGGPATAQAAWVPEMIQHAERTQAPLDFVSTHVYGNDSAKDVFGTDEEIPRSDMVARAVRKVHDEVKASSRPNLPIIWSEYNASYKNEVEVTDSAYMGPWLANNIRLCDGLTTMMSYWTFSDVFEEQGIVKKPFYGGYGLVAEGGLPKAAWNAFRMLHELGTERISNQAQDALVTRTGPKSLAVAVWNYAEPSAEGPARSYTIAFAGKQRAKSFAVEILDPQHGSALAAWEAIAQPQFPTPAQNKALGTAALATVHQTGPTFALPAHGLALVKIELR